MSNNLYNEHKKNIYMKYLIHKIIESKLTKIQNSINNNKFLLDFNYSNVKNEFKNILNHKGGDYFGPSPSLYTYPIYLRDDTIFMNDNNDNYSNSSKSDQTKPNVNKDKDKDKDKDIIIKKENIKKMYDEIIKIKHVFTKISEKESEVINRMNNIIEDINKYIKEDNNEEEINKLFTKFLNIIKQFNTIECKKLKKLIDDEHPELSEKINKLCKKD